MYLGLESLYSNHSRKACVIMAKERLSKLQREILEELGVVGCGMQLDTLNYRIQRRHDTNLKDKHVTESVQNLKMKGLVDLYKYKGNIFVNTTRKVEPRPRNIKEN